MIRHCSGNRRSHFTFMRSCLIAKGWWAWVGENFDHRGSFYPSPGGTFSINWLRVSAPALEGNFYAKGVNSELNVALLLPLCFITDVASTILRLLSTLPFDLLRFLLLPCHVAHCSLLISIFCSIDTPRALLFLSETSNLLASRL
jgi:hypothetical protein